MAEEEIITKLKSISVDSGDLSSVRESIQNSSTPSAIDEGLTWINVYELILAHGNFSTLLWRYLNGLVFVKNSDSQVVCKLHEELLEKVNVLCNIFYLTKENESSYTQQILNQMPSRHSWSLMVILVLCFFNSGYMKNLHPHYIAFLGFLPLMKVG
ncbi:uncharacterized protein LOC113355954 isoform X2 [Papaver somniferum]|uniref:uncharacterized protein LOC113355954 isoform X2 n=1 Tax=Papaver somniferum TaxID=3469 RepID=UPI000E701F37|nr:uncharacterized protein LOC113355954 isoform X2 [Papaver somniferum]